MQELIKKIYEDILYQKCRWEKDKTLFVEDTKFNDGSIPSGALHMKLMNMIQGSISENSPEIISNLKYTEDQKGDQAGNLDDDDKKQQNQDLIASISKYQIAQIEDGKFVDLILFCGILNGSMKLNDDLLMLPANVQVTINSMRDNGGTKTIFASKHDKLTVKIRLKYELWERLRTGQRYKILPKSKHLLVSKDCIDSFNWNTVNVYNERDHSYRENGIDIKLFLSSRSNYIDGIFKKSELCISYLGHQYSAKILDFVENLQPSIDTIPEWKAIFDIVQKKYKLELSNDIIRTIAEYILIIKEWELKMGILQDKYMKINVIQERNISFSTKKPFNKFCVLARNEIVCNGKFLSLIDLNVNKINFDSSIFKLTENEKYNLIKWIPNIGQYSSIELFHREVEMEMILIHLRHCAYKGPTLTLIETKINCKYLVHFINLISQTVIDLVTVALKIKRDLPFC